MRSSIGDGWFTSTEDVQARRQVTGKILAEAIEIERSGRKVEGAAAEPMPEELHPTAWRPSSSRG
jgi:uncharacterized protein YdeI (YjbR/CyaY-like superfamily)